MKNPAAAFQSRASSHTMPQLEEFIVQYGYLALFLGTFLEGETILIVAGYLASIGYLDIIYTVVVAFLGTFAGDQTFFFLGRFKGIGFLDNHPGWRKNVDKAFDLLSRYEIAVILGFRFLYGIRNVTPFVIGASGLRPVRFFCLNFLGAGLWAITFGVLGFQIGTVVETVLHVVKKYELIALGVFLSLAMVHFLWTKLRRR